MSLDTIVGYVSDGTIRHEFHDSLLHLVLQNGIGGRVCAKSGPRIASARNQIVRSFLEQTDKEYLWMVDTDMVFGPDVLNDLLRCDKDIVGALCYGQSEQSDDIFPVLHRFTDSGGLRLVKSPPKNKLIEVDATGAACLLIHRDVLEKMQANADNELYPWFQEGRTLGKLEVGEDVCFCLKAKEQDYKIHVHTGIKVGHVKTRIIGGE